MSDIKMSERFGRVPDFDIKEFFEDTQNFAIPNVHLCYRDINKAVNNHDRLVEENAELKKERDFLADTIDDLSEHVGESELMASGISVKFDRLKEENAQLKAGKAELVKALEIAMDKLDSASFQLISNPNHSTWEMGQLMALMAELLQKHKEQNNA